MTIRIVIDGQPIAKQRHRTLKSGRSYNPQSEEEAAYRWEIKHLLPLDFHILTGPIILTIDAHYERPKGHYGTGRNAGKLKASAPKYKINKPDVDNIAKWVMDAMNGIVYEDDQQVILLSVIKQYSDRPCTIIMFDKGEL